MENTVVRVILSLTGPIVLTTFSLAFAGVWLMDRRLSYVPLLALGCLFFSLGSILQIFYWPRDDGLNSLVTGAFYTAAVLLSVQGILKRSNSAFDWRVCAGVFFLIMILLWYFFYIDRNLMVRIYVQNFGYGLIMLAAAVPLARRSGRHPIDRILFWILLLFGLHFFPQTFLTLGEAAPSGARDFGNSLFWQALLVSLGILSAMLAVTLLFAAFSDMLEDIRRERDFDALTGLLNRRGFEERLNAILPDVSRPVSLVLCDVDHFKSINDQYGHQQGDVVLREVGRILRNTARQCDIAGRLGGEEFAVLLPGAKEDEALECAERIRMAIQNHHYSLPPGARQVTASFGVARRMPSDDWSLLFKRADSRLYSAKRSGRNRTVSDDRPLAVRSG